MRPGAEAVGRLKHGPQETARGGAELALGGRGGGGDCRGSLAGPVLGCVQ